jgi:hypothetical protein
MVVNYFLKGLIIKPFDEYLKQGVIMTREDVIKISDTKLSDTDSIGTGLNYAELINVKLNYANF